MYTRHRVKKPKNKYMKVAKGIFFVVLSLGAVKLGVMGGDTLSKADKNIVQKVDVGNFKTTLNRSYPMIDMVYNSGNMSTSFSGEVKDLIRNIFSFDLDNPLTILNAESTLLYSYYGNSYQIIADNGSSDYKIDYSNLRNGEENENKNGYKQDESSISYEGEEEKGNISKDGVVESGKIVVHNETKYKIDVDKLLKEPLKWKFDKKGPKALIYHTHTTESYINNLKELDNPNAPNRTRDPRYNVVRVGEELADKLRDNYDMGVVHNGTINDYPDYNASYTKGYGTVTSILKSYPSAKLVFDVHRDAMGQGKKLRVVKDVDNKKVAQVMFVVATGEVGLSHPDWRENLKLALKLQQSLNQQCPGLARPILISKYRYNQHVSPGALIIEVGGDGNLLEECLESTKYLAKAIHDVTNSQ